MPSPLIGLSWQHFGNSHIVRCVRCVSLPEAPQHRCWREAREAARVEIDQLHADLGMLLKEAMSHHRAHRNPHQRYGAISAIASPTPAHGWAQQPTAYASGPSPTTTRPISPPADHAKSSRGTDSAPPQAKQADHRPRRTTALVRRAYSFRSAPGDTLSPIQQLTKDRSGRRHQDAAPDGVVGPARYDTRST
jgi:hypothetical protein